MKKVFAVILLVCVCFASIFTCITPAQAEPTVDLYVEVDESLSGINRKETKVFANGTAQVPVTVYVNFVPNSGDIASIVDVGLVEKQKMSTPYILPDNEQFPIPPDGVIISSSVDMTKSYEAYPEIVDNPETEGIFTEMHKFLVTVENGSLGDGESLDYNLMAYAHVENFHQPSISDDGDGVCDGQEGSCSDVVVYTNREAGNYLSDTSYTEKNDGVRLEAVGVPELELSTSSIDIDEDSPNSHDFGNDHIYLIDVDPETSSDNYEFIARDVDVYEDEGGGITDGSCEYPDYITQENGACLREIAFDGKSAGWQINKIARCFLHLSANGKITQDLDKEKNYVTYEYAKNSAIASASCFDLKDAAIEDDNADMDGFENNGYIVATDKYGNRVKIVAEPTVEATNDISDDKAEMSFSFSN